MEGMIGQPRYLNPLLSDPNPVDRNLVDLIFDGLTRYNEDGKIEPALAKSWTISEDGLNYSFELRDDVRWHDGEPVTIEDVVFTFHLLQRDDFPAPDHLRKFWQSITISPTNDTKIEYLLPQPYSPFLDATTRGILPAHLLDNVPVSDVSEHSLNRSPIGTGPFMVAPGSDWLEDGFLRLVPNPNYWRSGTRIELLEFHFFPNNTSLLQAFGSGDIQAVTILHDPNIASLGSLPDIKIFSSAAPRFTQLIFNMTDSANPAIRSLAIRQGIAQALDRNALIDQAVSGQGLPLNGPYLPNSWAYNPAAISSFQFNPDSSTSIFETEGWLSTEGNGVREKDGVSFSLRLLTETDPVHMSLAQNIAEQLGKIGIEVGLDTVKGPELREALSGREFDMALIDVEPLRDPDLYDFWSQEAIVRGQNFSGWNNRLASEALEEARKITLPEGRQPYYDVFLRYFSEDLPAITLFQHLQTYAISDKVNQVEIGRIDAPRERFETFPQWFLEYQDVTIACPELDT